MSTERPRWMTELRQWFAGICLPAIDPDAVRCAVPECHHLPTWTTCSNCGFMCCRVHQVSYGTSVDWCWCCAPDFVPACRGDGLDHLRSCPPEPSKLLPWWAAKARIKRLDTEPKPTEVAGG